jgi:hypothetical protein
MRGRTGVSAVVVALGLGLAGCSDSPVAGNEAQDRAGSGPVTFVIVAEGRRFARDSEVRSLLWSAEQLEALKRNSRCSISQDPATGAEEIRCPEGGEYREVVPEEFTAPVRQPRVRLEFQSNTVEVGEEFRLVVSGLSSDGCNLTSATLASRAASPRLVLDDLEWERSMRGCPAS